MFKSVIYIIFLNTAIILAGCATLQPFTKTKTDWETKGKISFTNGKEANTASIYWQQIAEKYHIRLSGPFGANTMLIDGGPDHVQIKSSDGEHHNKSSLIAPINSLSYWIRGQADPTHAIEEITYSQNKKNIIELKQLGWNIIFDNHKVYKNKSRVISMPRKIILELAPENIQIKIILIDWQLPN